MKRYQIKVIPRSSRNEVQEISPDQLKVKLTTPPIDGKANEALIEVLAKHYKIRKSSIRIVTGFQSKIKVVEFDEAI